MSLRRLLILSHRYLGIAISMMFVIWFASGIVMIYAGDMPRLDQRLRLDRMPALDFTQVKLTPAQAMDRVAALAAAEGDPGPGSGIALLSALDRPAYRVQGALSGTIFADTGEILPHIEADSARTVASRFLALPERSIELVATLDKPDQWTLSRRADMPLYRFRANDEAKTEVYVSARSAEAVVLTTRATRALAWTGAIPHWLYFTALRSNQPFWYKLVVWLSSLGCLLAALGLLLAFTQFRRVRPFRFADAIPYRGWMRWHYILGAIFGVFALTWVFSGLLSMEPFAWTNARGLEMPHDVLSGGPPRLSSFDALDRSALPALVQGRTIKEVAFVRIQDEDYYAISASDDTQSAGASAELRHEPYAIAGRGEPERTLVAAATLAVRRDPFPSESIVTRLAAAAPQARIIEQQLLPEYDSYYYSRGGEGPLPVLRVKFDDPAQTWFYVDPRNSQMLAQLPRLSRLERWLYNGLHSLDFSFWYGRRPLWDIVVIFLCLGGLATSCLGFYVGVKRLINDLRPEGSRNYEHA